MRRIFGERQSVPNAAVLYVPQVRYTKPFAKKDKQDGASEVTEQVYYKKFFPPCQEGLIIQIY